MKSKNLDLNNSFKTWFATFHEYPEVAQKVDSILNKQLSKGELGSFFRLLEKYVNVTIEKKSTETILDLKNEIDRQKRLIEKLTDVLS
jgi:hypothetical protein